MRASIRSLRTVAPGRALRPGAALALLAAAPAAAAGQGRIRGTVHAPPGEDILGAVIVACFAENGRCAYASPHRNSRVVQIEARGASAPFLIRGLVPGEYVILGTRDIDANGVEDVGDWIAKEAELRPIRPPAEGIEPRFAYKTPAAAIPARRPARPRDDPAGVPRAPGLAMPPHGLAVPFDWEGGCSIAPAWCGTYAVRGDGVRIRWLTGEERVLRINPDGSLRTTEGRTRRDLHLRPRLPEGTVTIAGFARRQYRTAGRTCIARSVQPMTPTCRERSCPRSS